MLSEEEVSQKEEEIRMLVRNLSNDQKTLFYQQVNQQIKDPDTYATLNYIFIAGLHHFYLGRWTRGLLNLFVFIIGLLIIFMGQIRIGIGVILIISAVELYALFRSQVIVQNYNNMIMEKIYSNIKRY